MKAKPAWLLKVPHPSASVTEALETPDDRAPTGKLSLPAFTGRAMHNHKTNPIPDGYLSLAQACPNFAQGLLIIAVRLFVLSVSNL